MKTIVEDYVNAILNTLANENISPCLYPENQDDFVDALLDRGRAVYGPPNAAQRSALIKWAREDWEQYYAEIE